uniref:Tudor domain-containing protein n=1 Tax=Timema monikensis TaxID=170555 RepID=A0A7R9HNQ5_9NEOP|nr:unnamed protein product [Timema monikensis]
MMCAALYENEWYRARVVSDTPQLLLHYIDYGNTEECLLKNIRNLPLSVTNTPDLATRVRILDGTSTKCLKKPDSILSIRKVGIAPDGVVVVEEKIDGNESLPVGSSCTNQEVQAIVANGYLQSSQEKTIDVTEELQEYFEVIVSEINGPGDYWVQRVQQAKDLIAFQIYLFKKAPECSNLQPEVGLVCLAPFQGGWYRAKVKTLTPLLKIFYVDYGNTLEISHCDLKSLPPMSSLADIPAMAVRVKLVEGTSQNYQNLTVDSKFYIKFIGMTSGDIAYVQMKEADPEIHPKDAQTNVQQEMPPIPVMDEPTEPTVEVPAATAAIKTMQDLPDTFTQVKVSYKNGSTNYWVRLVEQDEIFRRILVELNHAEVNVFIKNPKVGTLVSAYSDGCWCRARVKAVEPHLIVHYIDFGNTEVTTLDNLRPLPETLVQDPDLALKIQLADVTSENYHNLEDDAPLNVKPVGKSEDGSIIVQVEGDNYENKNTTQHSQAAHLPNQALQASLSPSQAPQASLPSSQASQASHPPNQAPQASHPPSHSPKASHPPIQTTQASDQQSQAQHASNTSGQLSKPMALSSIIAKDETMLAEPAGNQQSAFVDTMQDLPETLTQVKVILTNSSSNYWVQRVDQETALNGILLALFNQTLESLSVKLEIGLMCVGYYENHWYRVRVKTLKPQLTVHFVDYGNTETTTSDQLRQLPESLSSEPDLAMRIQLAEGTSEQYQNKRENDLLTVKSVGKLKDGSILVHVEGEDYSTKVEKFVSNSSTEVYVTVANGPCDYWVQTKKCSETARNITLKLNKIVSDCSPVVPKIGLACSALFMGDW